MGFGCAFFGAALSPLETQRKKSLTGVDAARKRELDRE